MNVRPSSERLSTLPSRTAPSAAGPCPAPAHDMASRAPKRTPSESPLPVVRDLSPSRKPHIGLHKLSTALRALPLWQKVLALSILALLLFRALLVRSPPHDFDAPAPPDGARARTLQTQLDHLTLSGATQAADALRRAALDTYQAGGDQAGGTAHSADSQHKSPPTDLDARARSLLDGLLTHKATVPCAYDATLPLAVPRAERVLFAADLHNNQHVLPHFTQQLLQIIAILGPSRVYVSVYESGSTDSTTEWLALLTALLDCLGVRSRVVVGGTETRAEGQERIDFLARVRCAAALTNNSNNNNNHTPG